MSFLLNKNKYKDFSCIKTWSNTHRPSQNYGPPNLLFRFANSYVCKIAIMSWIPISKLQQIEYLPESLKLFLPIYYKVAVFSIFSKTCQKYIVFGRYFLFWQPLTVNALWKCPKCPKMPFEILEICEKIFFACLAYVACRYMKYLIFTVSKICPNCCFMITNQCYIS